MQNISHTTTLSVTNHLGGDTSGDRDQDQGQREDRDADTEEFQEEQGNEKKTKKNDNSRHGGGTGHATSLHINGDVANLFDILDFIDDPIEMKDYAYELTIKHILPHIEWLDGSTGISIKDIATEENNTSHPDDEVNDNSFAPLSEKNVLQHNVATSLKGTFSTQFWHKLN
jgi:hypothetical protein